MLKILHTGPVPLVPPLTHASGSATGSTPPPQSHRSADPERQEQCTGCPGPRGPDEERGHSRGTVTHAVHRDLSGGCGPGATQEPGARALAPSAQQCGDPRRFGIRDNPWLTPTQWETSLAPCEAPGPPTRDLLSHREPPLPRRASWPRLTLATWTTVLLSSSTSSSLSRTLRKSSKVQSSNSSRGTA